MSINKTLTPLSEPRRDNASNPELCFADLEPNTLYIVDLSEGKSVIFSRTPNSTKPVQILWVKTAATRKLVVKIDHYPLEKASKIFLHYYNHGHATKTSKENYRTLSHITHR